MAKFGLNIGDVVYKYQLQELIGSGHFGEVWRANDNALDREFAIKLLDASGTSIDTELMEARIGNRMQHHNLVQVHIADIVQIKGVDTVVIAMNYLRNGSIISKICAGNFVPQQLAVKTMIDTLRGLEFLHDNGFYHNDIKPQNILIGDNQEGILTDYGISGATVNGQAITPKDQYRPHKAPETFENGLIDGKTEVYQAGITLFRLVNGLGLATECFNNNSSAEYEKLVKEGKLLDKMGWQLFVPNSLKKIIRKATNSDKKKRYSSVLEMRRALEKLKLPNSWTCNSAGKYLCENATHIYEFEIIFKPNGLVDFVAYKTIRKSGRKQKFGKFTEKNAQRIQITKLQRHFMTSITEGKCK